MIRTVSAKDVDVSPTVFPPHISREHLEYSDEFLA